MKIFGHCCYFGNSGYAIHSKNFFRELSKLSELKIRNFSVDSEWKGLYNENPYGASADELDKNILSLQSLATEKGNQDFEVFSGTKDFENDVDIVLVDCYHEFFYTEYKKLKVFYNVWEKTRYPVDFFVKLMEADQLWVPTQWQANVAIKQGYPENKIKIVPEGIDPKVFYPENKKYSDKFSFLILGKWEDRKSTKEIVQAFVELFGDNENIELLLSCDNNFPTDNFKTTEERLSYYDLNRKNIKIIHFKEQHELINIMKSVNVFLSCSRSEGWNLPLIEAMACGIPSLYSECSGQLEFAKNLGIPIKVHGEITDIRNKMHGWYSPDYNDLKIKMFEVYHSYDFYKNKALKDSEIIRTKFTWQNAAKIAISHLNNKQTDVVKKKVKIINESGSLGDFLAWTPVVARYADEKNVSVDYYTPHKDLLKSSYKNINFYNYAETNLVKYDDIISIGCFDQLNWQETSLQEVASMLLNLDHKEVKCKMPIDYKKQRPMKEKYVCIGVQSTSQCKYWNNADGWNKVVKYLNYLGYKVVCIDKNSHFGIAGHMNSIPKGAIDNTGDKPLMERINYLMHCEFFIGLSSGLSWLAWACDKPVVMISGFTNPKLEFTNPYRIHNSKVCNSCWNDPEVKFDKNNWLWCPKNKDFECSKQITFESVKQYIDNCIEDLSNKTWK
jgi:autotransporter strand-loop-strand O-heptosyltransferase